jgi:hypothetical protein
MKPQGSIKKARDNQKRLLWLRAFKGSYGIRPLGSRFVEVDNLAVIPIRRFETFIFLNDVS